MDLCQRVKQFLAAGTIALAATLTPAKAYDNTLDLPVVAPETKYSKPKPPESPQQEDGDKPPTFYGQEIKSENNTIYYVIDISGSMMYDLQQYTTTDGDVKTGNRLERAKVALIKSISSLPENFKFNALAYDCSIYPCFDEKTLQSADKDNKAAAIGWATGLEPNGGTGTAMGVGVALNIKANKLVLLLTDGDPNCNAINWGGNAGAKLHREDIRLANTQNASINVYGIGATGTFKKFCMDVASDNNGTYTDAR